MQWRRATPEDLEGLVLDQRQGPWTLIAVPTGHTIVPASEVDDRALFAKRARRAGNDRGLGCSIFWKPNGDAVLTFRRRWPDHPKAVERFGPYRPSSDENIPRSLQV
jgi:hypothetical protein